MEKFENIRNSYCFILEMEVRDYELDCEQIVNNANYLHYIEHTRHKFCQAAGYPFIEMHNKGIDAVVRKIEMEYFTPLRSGDIFLSCIRLERKGARYIFFQDIWKKDGTKVLESIVNIVILKDGRISRGEEIAHVFNKFIESSGK